MEGDTESTKSFGLSKEQKVGFALLSVFAILTLAIGVMQIRNTMYGPFSLNKVVPTDIKEKINSTDALRFRDTDNDGINDFDELYVYTTSPYLADSDSDGIDDLEEVTKGTNPNCVEGQTCSALAESQAVRNTSSSLLIIGQEVDSPGEEPTDLSQALQDPLLVRQMLVESGMDADALKTVSDEQLMALVNDLLANTSTIDLPTSTNLFNNLTGTNQ